LGNGFPCLLNWKLQINDNPACIKAMSILYRLVILMELLQGKGIDVRSNDKEVP
jgi:hypothetical protein